MKQLYPGHYILIVMINILSSGPEKLRENLFLAVMTKLTITLTKANMLLQRD